MKSALALWTLTMIWVITPAAALAADAPPPPPPPTVSLETRATAAIYDIQQQNNPNQKDADLLAWYNAKKKANAGNFPFNDHTAASSLKTLLDARTARLAAASHLVETYPSSDLAEQRRLEAIECCRNARAQLDANNKRIETLVQTIADLGGRERPSTHTVRDADDDGRDFDSDADRNRRSRSNRGSLSPDARRVLADLLNGDGYNGSIFDNQNLFGGRNPGFGQWPQQAPIAPWNNNNMNMNAPWAPWNQAMNSRLPNSYPAPPGYQQPLYPWGANGGYNQQQYFNPQQYYNPQQYFAGGASQWGAPGPQWGGSGPNWSGVVAGRGPAPAIVATGQPYSLGANTNFGIGSQIYNNGGGTRVLQGSYSAASGYNPAH